MSGGVDSSVAAARCARRGLEVIGVTLAMWPRSREIERDRGCCSVEAVEDARRVARRIGIDHYTWNLEREFEDGVTSDFEAEHLGGRTPNPCIRCNERIKFGALLHHARLIGASHVATGHYARIGRRSGRLTLHRGAEPRKDQAYTLHRLTQEQLAHAAFPLGCSRSKAEVRQEAERLGLPTAAKPDSQELCFVDGSVRDHLRVRLAGRFRPGPIVDAGGTLLGEHEGLPLYTVGQRTRLGCRPRGPSSPALYVTAIDRAANALVVGPLAELLTSTIIVDEASWVGGRSPLPGTSCEVQLTAHGPVHPATAGPGAPAATHRGPIELRLPTPVRRPAPGQSAVLFDGDEVLGGGIVADAAGGEPSRRPSELVTAG